MIKKFWLWIKNSYEYDECIGITPNGALYIKDIKKYLSHPNAQRQIKAVQALRESMYK